MSTDKRKEPFHPKRAMLVEHISDDVRVLHATNQDLQKTLLTGRALMDLGKSETFDFSRNSDKKYYYNSLDRGGSGYGNIEEWTVPDTQPSEGIDLDRCVDAMSRYLPEDGYVNYPIVWDSAWGAYLTVTAALTDFKTGTGGANKDILRKAPEVGAHVRQIIYPEGDRYFDAYTRVGVLQENGLVPCASLSFDPDATYYQMVDDEAQVKTGVTSSNFGSLKSTLYVQGHVWMWEDWQSMSGRKIRIRVGDTSEERLKVEVPSNIRPNYIYELYTGATINLPDPSSIMPGSTVTFEQYPNPDMSFTSCAGTAYQKGTAYYKRTSSGSGTAQRYTYHICNAASGTYAYPTEATFNANKSAYYTADRKGEWSSVVRYEDVEDNNLVTDANGNAVNATTEVTREIVLMPSYDAERASVTDIAGVRPTTVANSQPQSYVFEVVHTRLGGVTWMLHTEIESVDDIAGFAELLDSHTDPKQSDIFQYRARQFSNESGISDDEYKASLVRTNEPLIIQRSVNAEGWVKVSATALSQANAKKLGKDFLVKIYVFNEYDSSFEKFSQITYVPVADTSGTPNPYIQYYKPAGNGVYKKWNMSGFITEFLPGEEYYVLSSVDVNCPAAKMVAADPDTTVNKLHWYTAEFYGVKTTATNEAQTAADARVGGSAFGCHNEAGTTFNAVPAFTGYIRAHRNDTVVIVVYPNKTTATDAQLGHNNHRNVINMTVEILPDVHDTYLPKGIMGPNNKIPLIGESKRVVTPLAAMEDATVALTEHAKNIPAPLDVVAMLHEVLTSKLQSRGMLFGNVLTTNLNNTTATGFYTINSIAATSLPGYIGSGNITNAQLVVVNSSTTEIGQRLTETEAVTAVASASSGSVTQILVLNNNGAKMWIRARNSAGNWTTWMAMQGAPQTCNASSGANVTADSVASWLNAYGEPHIVVKGSGTDTARSVVLPDPANYKYRKLLVEAQGCSVVISYQANSNTYSFTGSNIAQNGDRFLYPVHCDEDGNGGFAWYVVIVN